VKKKRVSGAIMCTIGFRIGFTVGRIMKLTAATS
jgi:hypothetical protein